MGAVIAVADASSFAWGVFGWVIYGWDIVGSGGALRGIGDRAYGFRCVYSMRVVIII